MKASGTCKPVKWDETTLVEISPAVKTTRASVVYAFSGGIDGRADAEMLMYYPHVDPTDPHKSTARYVGLLQFTVTLDGRAGSFVVEEAGRFEGGLAASTLTIMDGSGTGALAGIRGAGRFHATKDAALCELDYDV
ncbi:MAG TPA: DUF3224 domain-containing protein [Gemmatimonadales bacterium]|jgi:hypothetical protein|nr:DUF3224 domain-containing protein [Gemmatimonadales bacterium]